MNLIKNIERKLKEKLRPLSIEFTNNSPLHKNHIEDTEKTLTHLHIKITSDIFNEINILERHKKVYEAIKDEILQIHALSIDAIPTCSIDKSI